MNNTNLGFFFTFVLEVLGLFLRLQKNDLIVGGNVVLMKKIICNFVFKEYVYMLNSCVKGKG